MSGDLNMNGNTITGLFQMPPTPFQTPQNPADANMQKYIEDLRKNTTYDNYATAFLIMKNFLAVQLLLTTITIRWVQKHDWKFTYGK